MTSILAVIFALAALGGLLALGRLLARWLDRTDNAKSGEHVGRMAPPRNRRLDATSLHARLMRATIAGPEDEP